MTIPIDIEGPAFGQVSFAHVVRSIAFALEDLGCEVSLQATDAKKDGYKRVATERNFNRLREMAARKPAGLIKILYNFPVSMRNRCGGYNFAITSWETTSAPVEWVRDLNRNADQVWSISNFVNEAFLSAGLQKAKAKVIPMGADPHLFHDKVPPATFNTKKKFKFLHLGVAQERKGTPLLLRAYSKAFRAKDDVVLIIKSNGFGVVDRWVKDFQKPGMPEIIYIYEEAHELALAGYYTASDCFVYPVHAEGAGLPVLESLACGKPAIVPMWSGLTDFCNQSNSFSVRYKVSPLKKPYSTYSKTVPETWAELSESDLVAQLRYAYQHQCEVKKKGAYAASYIGRNFTWLNTARKILEYVSEFAKKDEITKVLNASSHVKPRPVPKSIPVDDAAPVVASKIGLLTTLSPYLESYHYFKASLDHTMSQTVPFVCKESSNRKYVPCVEPGQPSPKAIVGECRRRDVRILQIHWDKELVPWPNLSVMLRELQKSGISTIVMVHDEMEGALPVEFFYLANFFVTNSVKTRNRLLALGCPLDRLRYLPPISIPKVTVNRANIRREYGLGPRNFVLMSPTRLDAQSDCLRILEDIEASIPHAPYLQYLIVALGGDPVELERHKEAIRGKEGLVGIITNLRDERQRNEVLSMADAVIMPFQSSNKAPKNPSLIPAMNLGVPILADRDSVVADIQHISVIGTKGIHELANDSVIENNGLGDVRDYVKMMESLYYTLSHAAPPQEMPAPIEETIIELTIDINKPIEFAEL